MRETSLGPGEKEPSAEHAAIQMAEVLQRLGPLQVRLSEHRTAAATRGPSATTKSARLQQSILEVLIDTAIQAPGRSTIYLHEVALEVQERTGLDVVRAATVPFVPRTDAPGYLPDFMRLAAETGPDDLAFSAAYMTVREYLSGAFPLDFEQD